MKLEDLGYSANLREGWGDIKLDDFEIGRIISEHKERYIVGTEHGESEAEITGNLRFTALNREDFPAVGDWVSMTSYDRSFAVIHEVLPRYSTISRQAVGQAGAFQIIATNVDYAFIVQAVERDFNLNRLERYLTICHASRVSPILVLTKTDLKTREETDAILARIHQRIQELPVIAISNETREGYDALSTCIEKGKTYCMLGSSGVGKSTLINNLSERNIMKTGAISENTNKGRHITSHRELIVLENGGILIDNPGMREVGIADTAQGLESTFDQIIDLSKECKYKDCTHSDESGCAVLEAVESGKVDLEAFENFQKMEKEKAFFDSSLVERRKRDKEFGKMVKHFKIDRNKNKY